MDQGYKTPQNDFEVIEHFDSYEDDNLAVEMVDFYGEKRAKGIPLEEAYLETLQTYDTPQKSLSSTDFNTDRQTTNLHYVL